MTERRCSRAELLAMYDEAVELRRQAGRLNDGFLAYLSEIIVQELRDRLGADLPMPRTPEAELVDDRSVTWWLRPRPPRND